MTRVALAAVVLTVCLAGCGSTSRTRPNPCPAGPGAGRVTKTDIDLLVCAYPGASISVDSAPQAAVRFEREEVELGQNTASGWRQDLARRPQTVFELGTGAFWVAGDHRLVATDDTVLLTVVLTGTNRTRARAIAVTRTALRPTRRPR